MSIPLLAQNNDTVGIVTNNTNFNFIRNLTPAAYVGSAINILLGLAGIASFIFLILGGLQWITGGGDKDAAEKARKKIMQALTGLAIVFSSYAILYVMRVLFHVDIIAVNISPLGSN